MKKNRIKPRWFLKALLLLYMTSLSGWSQINMKDEHIREYLDASYTSKIEKVVVTESSITIHGYLSGNIPALLCESAPYQDVTEGGFETEISVTNTLFSIEVDRFENRDGILYDRMLSRWVLLNEENRELISHARYPDEINAVNDLPKEVPAGRKGLGDFSTRSSRQEYISDLEELDINSVTVNFWFMRFMYTQPGTNRIEHNYYGKSFYFDEEKILELDSTFRTTARRGIVTAAVLLVDKAQYCPDPEIGRLLQHPDMDPSGFYSMPNLTNPESVECYAAALDFFASRYSRPDRKYGRLNHWIVHNEIDAGWVWTNMGNKTDLIYMDTYLKSMRMIYAIARKYNPHSEAFISLTHNWTWTEDPRFFHAKDLLEIMLDYTEAEGDFQWALALHPYPESLFEPKTWLDKKVGFTFDTPLITFKNLEVIDAWIKLNKVLYKGNIKRTLWLSENGTNSPSYSEQDLKEQAAGCAYAWKKMKHLDGIDGFQWHSWFDNRGEGGLRLGLRRFSDDTENPGGAKPAYYAYQAADSDNEDAVFDQYKALIGINDWSEIYHNEEISGQVNEWYFENDLEGWAADNGCTIEAVDGKVVCTITGNDPYFQILMSEAWFPHDLKCLHLRMKNETNTDEGGFLARARDGSPGLLHYKYPISANDAKFVDLYINLKTLSGWQSIEDMNALVINPSESATGGTVSYDFIRFISDVPLLDSIEIAGESGKDTIDVGTTLQIQVTDFWPNIAGVMFIWSVDDRAIANINRSGLLTAIAAGTVNVTAIAIDGSNVSKTKAIEIMNNTAVEDISANQLKLYPNPAGSTLYIDHASQIERVAVTDITGQVIKEIRNNSETKLRIDTETLASGLYLIRATSIEGNVIIRTFIKK